MRYENLSDVDFELLCKDVMSKKLGVNLESFTAGKDGGIDLTDDASKKNIVVQVKHYVKTGVPSLIKSLKKELTKVDTLSPKQYYICCSVGLSPQKKSEIFNMFSSYMKSTQNIITSLELNEFLEEPANVDILRKHFKLWIDSTNILLDTLNNDIFLDSNTFVASIKEQQKYLVKTVAFDDAIKFLEKKNVLVIIGNPGVGKTITSKMLVLHYAAQGFRVRYTTDVSDLNSLKNSLVQSPEVKEIILLDDCFGQAYFNMKDTQETELLSLIRHVNINGNKILIMNSRVSIYNEAQNRKPELIKSFELKEYSAYILNMDNISLIDKAKIFYNHLYFNMPREYFEKIKENKNYIRIIKHKNYNPRIIEFVCLPNTINKITQEKYMSFIMQSLDNPEKIWKDEYEYRLNVVDRNFLMTLYSLTDTYIPLELFRKCFENIILNLSDIDSSINQFKQALNRLTNSMVRIIDNNGIEMVGVANPSVNDFLSNELLCNEPLKEFIIKYSLSVRQLKKLMNEEHYLIKVSKLFENKSILSFGFESDKQKEAFITAWCVLNDVRDLNYLDYINMYMFDIRSVDMYDKGRVYKSNILDKLLSKDFSLFYGIDKLFREGENLRKIIESLELEDVIYVIERIDWMFSREERPFYIETIQELLKDSMIFFCESVPAELYDDISLSKYMDICEVEEIIKDFVRDDLNSMLEILPKDINSNYIDISSMDIQIEGAERIISYYHDSFDEDRKIDEYFENRMIDEYLEKSEIEYIFNH